MVRPEELWERKKVCPYCGKTLDEDDKIDEDTYYCPQCDHEIDRDECE